MLIRNRKMLRAKRRRYSHLMLSFRAIAQKIARQDAMVEWLAKQLDDYGECSPPDAPCHEDGPYCCLSASPISCAKCWIKAAEKAVQDANRYYPTDKKKTAWCKMKHARLQIEEEMDGQNDD